jgi:hypothetical protein
MISSMSLIEVVSIDLCLPNNETAVNTDNKQQQYGGTENL